MASTPSGTVTQANLSGSELLYTDTGNYGTVSSRVLTIYDYQNNLVETYSMGANLTQIFPITADAWYMFVCTVSDNVGGSPWVTTVYFVATGFYTAAYLVQYTANQCGCIGVNCNMDAAENSYNAALRYNLAGEAGAASSQAAITAANVLINQNTTVQLA